MSSRAERSSPTRSAPGPAVHQPHRHPGLPPARGPGLATPHHSCHWPQAASAAGISPQHAAWSSAGHPKHSTWHAATSRCLATPFLPPCLPVPSLGATLQLLPCQAQCKPRLQALWPAATVQTAACLMQHCQGGTGHAAVCLMQHCQGGTCHQCTRQHARCLALAGLELLRRTWHSSADAVLHAHPCSRAACAAPCSK
jgi:hypothetical protein